MRIIALVLVSIFITSCDFYNIANEKFAKQHFISAISHIELHKIRNGTYPAELSDLEYLGDWDGIWIQSVDYRRTNGGYDLFVVRGHAVSAEVEFPESFRRGLGLVGSNVTWTGNDDG